MVGAGQFHVKSCKKKNHVKKYVKSFRLIMKNNFIQMSASAGHAVADTIGPIFKHIIACVQLYGFTNIIL